MLLGPIFAADVVTSVRRARYYFIRVLYGVVLLSILWMNFETWSGSEVDIQTAARMARGFFYSFTIVQLLAITGLGPALVAGTIALERERRTIEYLFATDLSNAEIIFGKLVARLMHIGAIVLVGLPVLSLAMLMGGIAPDQLFITFLVALSTMVAVASLSIAISVWTPRARDAVVRCYLVLFVLLIVPMFEALLALTWAAPWVSPILHPITLANPFVLTTQMVFSPNMLWTQARTLLVEQVGLAAVCAAMSVVAVRRVHLRSSGSVEKKSRFNWAFPMWRPTIGDHPMLWKELFARQAKMRLGWVGRIAVVLLVAGGFAPVTIALYQAAVYTSSSANMRYTFYVRQVVGFLSAINCVGLLFVVARAASSITVEKERLCWDSILITPLTSREIIGAKIAGALYSVRWLLASVVAVWVTTALIYPPYVKAIPLSLLTLAVLAVYASALGTICSLWSSNSLRAMGTAIGLGIFLGAGYLFCCAPFARGGNDEIILAPCIPFLLFKGGSAVVGPDHQGTLIPYIFGMVGYAVAALGLTGLAIDQLRSALDSRERWEPRDKHVTEEATDIEPID